MHSQDYFVFHFACLYRNKNDSWKTLLWYLKLTKKETLNQMNFPCVNIDYCRHYHIILINIIIKEPRKSSSLLCPLIKEKSQLYYYSSDWVVALILDYCLLVVQCKWVQCASWILYFNNRKFFGLRQKANELSFIDLMGEKRTSLGWRSYSYILISSWWLFIKNLRIIIELTEVIFPITLGSILFSKSDLE